MKNVRMVALKALLRVDVDDGYSNIVLNNTLKEEHLDSRDASFVAALFYGVLERRITIDYIISKYSKLQLKKISPTVLEILRIGAYQILYMDKVPDSAAVNESVKLARCKKQHSATGFINGVLRSISRNKDKVPMPSRDDKIAYFSVKYSCPEWIIDLWVKSYGEENTELMLNSMSGRPPLIARVNTTKTTTERLISSLNKSGINVRRSEVLGSAVELESTGALEEIESFRAGEFHIQDLASQICCYALGAEAGQTVIDVCSAPGGKAFTIAEDMQDDGKVYAFDLYESKANLINSGAKRLGLSIVKAEARDASKDGKELPFADRVLCDVPCSGLGILRRKPEIRYKKEIPLDNLYGIQYKILCESSKYTKVGGVLVYSTCTLNPNENGKMADKFLVEHKEYEPYKLILPEGIKSVLEEKPNQITLFPHIHRTDGFFISAFKRIR